MAAKTYKARALILRKTKLKEKDLIITMLSEDGSLLRAVAKGARKPGGSFAARAELFSEVDALLAKGRNLDTLCEAQLVGKSTQLIEGLIATTSASTIAETLSVIAQTELPQPRIYAMAASAFEHVRSDEEALAPVIASAALWKIMAQCGFRPHFHDCIGCGNALDDGGPAFFSAMEGGALCGHCIEAEDMVPVDPSVLKWCDHLLHSRFDEIGRTVPDTMTLKTMLTLQKDWIEAHGAYRSKAIPMLVSIL